MSMQKVWGYIPSPDGFPIQTEKAIRVTVKLIDGEFSGTDTVWLPRSILTDLKIETVQVGARMKAWEFSAMVPSWWVKKLDTRTSWEKRGEKSAPIGVRPW